MLSPDSKSDDTLAKPAQATGTPILDALRKMESGDSLTDTECTRMCQVIFMPAVSRKYDWVKHRAGVSQGAVKSISGSSEDQEDDYPHRLWREKTAYRPEPSDSKEAPELDADDVADTSGAELSEDDPLEDALQVGRPALDSKEFQRDPFSDPVITIAMSELWARFTRTDKSNDRDDDGTGDESGGEDESDEDVGDCREESSEAVPKLNIWQYALRSALREFDPDVRESTAIRYLRTCARNELMQWLQEGNCWPEIDSRLRKAIAEGGYTILRAGTRARGVYKHDRLAPAGHEDWPPLADIPTAELCRGLAFPALHGGSNRLFSPLPKPRQIRQFLRAFFKIHQAAPTIKQLMEAVQVGWKISDNRKTPLPDDSSPEETEQTGKPSSQDIRERLSTTDHRHARIEKLADLLIAAIEAVDGCRIDPPPNDPKAGKLGRLLLQYAIWAELPCTDTESGKYMIESYAKLTGYGMSTEYERYNVQLVGVFRELARKEAFDQQTVVDLTIWLREKYFHRKPETVAFDCLTHGDP